MNTIEHYSFGSIKVAGKNYSSDVIIYPDKVDSSWWRKSSHNCVTEDIKNVLDYNPEDLVIGTGAYGVMSVAGETKKLLQEKNINLLIEKTGRVVEVFNNLLNKGRRVVACLHLTC